MLTSLRAGGAGAAAKAWACAAAAGLSVAAALGAAPAGAQDLPAPVQQVFEQSILSIGLGDISGTGFIVSREGHVVTALHVLQAISKEGNKDISYFRTNYRGYLNAAGAGDENCSVRLNLMAADSSRDVAVLQIPPFLWVNRTEDPCLSRLEPAKLRWELPMRDASADATDGLWDESIWILGRQAGCRPGGGDKCLPLDFSAFGSRLHVKSDDYGLHGVDKEVLPGFSGGPAVIATGEVIGMTVASGKDLRVPQVKIAPVSQLHRPLWDFGLANLGEEEGFGDYVETMVSLLRNKRKIDRVLAILEDIDKEDLEDTMKTLSQIKNRLNRPELIATEVTEQNSGERVVQMIFRKQVSTAEDPRRMEFAISCVPKADSGWDFAAAQAARNAASREELEELEEEGNRLKMENRALSVKASDGVRLLATVPKPIDYLLDICVDYYRLIGEISRQSVELRKDDFVKMVIQTVAVFREKDGGDQAMDTAEVNLK